MPPIPIAVDPSIDLAADVARTMHGVEQVASVKTAEPGLFEYEVGKARKFAASQHGYLNRRDKHLPGWPGMERYHVGVTSDRQTRRVTVLVTFWPDGRPKRGHGRR